MKRGVLFDLDDTLYDYDCVNKAALSEVFQIFNKKIKKISKEKFMRLFNLSRTEIHQELSGTASAHNRTLYFQRLIEKTHHTVDPKFIILLDNTYWNAFLKRMKLFAGVKETLKELKKNDIKTVIVSDLTTYTQLRKIKKLGITPYIDFLVTSEEAGSEKPHLIMFLLALKKLGMSPQEVIFVGDDQKKDIAGANAAGMDTLWITKSTKTKNKNKDDYSTPDYYVRSVTDILEILKKLNEKVKS